MKCKHKVHGKVSPLLHPPATESVALGVTRRPTYQIDNFILLLIDTGETRSRGERGAIGVELLVDRPKG